MATGVWLALGCVTGGCAGVVAGCEAWGEVTRAYSVAKSLQHQGPHESRRATSWETARGCVDYWLRNGVQACNGLAGVLLGRPRVRRELERVCLAFAGRGVSATNLGLASCLVALMVVLELVLIALTRSFAVCCFVPPAVLGLGSVFVSKEIEGRERTLRGQIPDALRCMESCLHAGLSLPQAFKETAAECPPPAREVFEQVTHDLEMGFSMERALKRFYGNAELPELAFVAMALDVVYVCGGSAVPVLRGAEDSVAKGLELKRSLEVQTAQARLSARIVSLMPIALMAVLSLLSPGFLSPFFHSGVGVALFVLALGMEVAGIVVVRKALSVE